MKIDIENINHNALRLIEVNSMPWECADATDDFDHNRLVTSGYIRGVLDMANAMKEVLEV